MTDYIEKIQMNSSTAQYIPYGSCFRGPWSYHPLALASNQTFTKDTYTVWSLTDYIPDDGYDYEVMASFIGNTVNTANNNIYFWVRSGASNSVRYQMRLMGVANNSASNENGAGNIIIPVLSIDKNIGIYLESGAYNSGSCWFNLFGYRRLGKNEWSQTEGKMSNFQFDNKNLAFGGSLLPGKWVSTNVELLTNYQLAASSGEIKQISLSNVIPNDGYDYECIFAGYASTKSTSGQYISLRTPFPNTTDYMTILESKTNTASGKANYFNFRYLVRASNKTINIKNTGTSICQTSFRIRAYRRLGIYE